MGRLVRQFFGELVRFGDVLTGQQQHRACAVAYHLARFTQPDDIPVLVGFAQDPLMFAAYMCSATLDRAQRLGTVSGRSALMT